MQRRRRVEIFDTNIFGPRRFLVYTPILNETDDPGHRLLNGELSGSGGTTTEAVESVPATFSPRARNANRTLRSHLHQCSTNETQSKELRAVEE